jgi:hypothetical protein
MPRGGAAVALLPSRLPWLPVPAVDWFHGDAYIPPRGKDVTDRPVAPDWPAGWLIGAAPLPGAGAIQPPPVVRPASVAPSRPWLRGTEAVYPRGAALIRPAPVAVSLPAVGDLNRTRGSVKPVVRAVSGAAYRLPSLPAPGLTVTLLPLPRAVERPVPKKTRCPPRLLPSPFAPCGLPPLSQRTPFEPP